MSNNSLDDKTRFIVFTVQEDFIKNAKNLSIRSFLNYKFQISIRLIRNIKYKGGELLLNNKPAKFIDKVKLGDHIKLVFPVEKSNLAPLDKPLNIIYEDDYLIAVNKPPLLVVHPTKNFLDNTLLNQVYAHAKNKNEQYIPRLVNRLDRDTSGIVLIAKNPIIQDNFFKQVLDDKVDKTYNILVHGFLDKKKGVIKLPIKRALDNDPRRIVADDGKLSITKYEVLKEGIVKSKKISLIKAKLLTGRTHQLRVHFSYIGHPILGDELYGEFKEENNKNKDTSFLKPDLDFIERQAIHAYSLSFFHPILEKDLQIVAPFPDDFKTLMNEI